MALFTTIIFGQDRHPVPKTGVGRVHRIEDENVLPGQNQRHIEIVLAIEGGARTIDQIVKHLSFITSRQVVIADCQELVQQGRLIETRSKGRPPQFMLTNALVDH